jgi:predicted nucleotidyltransferase
MLEYYYYGKEIKALNKNRIRYLVIGGMAVNLYGIHRLTRDLDLMIDLSEGHLQKFLKVIKPLGYYTKVPNAKWKELNAVAFINHRDEDKRIDVFLKNPTDFESAYKKRKIFRADNFRISCISLEGLIKLKNKADRLRDWVDIGSIKRMQELKKKK